MRSSSPAVLLGSVAADLATGYGDSVTAPNLPGTVMPTVTSPKHVAAGLSEHWSPRIVAEVDDSYVKVAKVLGTFGWHSHEDEDELFLVLKGRLRIELEDDGAVELDEGDVFVVPKGVRHNPVAQEECHVMLIERKSTLHTGNTVTARTRSIAEQLGEAAPKPAG